MKNIFKLMGIAVLACGMMVACNKENNENNNGGNGGNGGNQQQEEQIPDGVKVVFGDANWTGNIVSVNYMSSYGAIQFTAMEVENDYPMFDEAIYTTEVGTTTESFSEAAMGFPQGSTHAWCEYYERTTLSDGQSNYGDWWAAEATTEIKAIDMTNMTVTAKLNGTMFDAAEAFVESYGRVGYASASRKAYNVTFGKVAMTE